MKVEDILAKAKQFVAEKAFNLSGKGKVVVGCLAIGAVALSLTNPKKEAYVEHTSIRLSREIQRKCDQFNPDVDVQILVLRVPVEVACKFSVSRADVVLIPASRLLVTHTTDSPKNFMLFSVYTTQLPRGKPFRTIGIGNQFIGLPG